MKKRMIILSLMLLTLNLSLVSISCAKERRQRGRLGQEAMKIRRGERSPGDLAKWQERLGRLRSLKKWGGVALCYNVIGVIHLHDGNLDEALWNLNLSLRMSRKKGFERMLAQNLFWIGVAKKNKGLLEDALKSLKESLEIAKSIDHKEIEGRSLVTIGSILLIKGRSRESMDYLKRALPMAEEMQDNMLIMSCLSNMGKIYKNLGNYEKARGYFTRALEISQGAENKKWTAHNLSGLGEISARQKDYQSALEYFQKSLALYEDLDLEMGLAVTNNKMGKIYLKMKDIERALGYFEKSYDVAKAVGMKLLMASTSQNIGRAYGRMGKWDKALQKTDVAINIFREVDVPDALQDSYHMKGRFLEKKGDMVGAEKNYKESVKILETLREDVVGGEEEMLVFVEKRGKVYQRLIGLLLKQGKVAEAMKYLERSRLKTLRDQFDQLRPNLNNEEEEKAKEKERELRKQIEEARTELTDEQSKPRAEQNVQRIAELEKTLSVMKQEYIEYVNDLREKFPDLASLLAIQPDTLIDLQNLLPPQAAIVQYLILKERLYIFVVTNESLSYKEVNVTQEDLEGKIDYLRSLLMNPQIPLNMGPLEVETLKPKEKGRSDLYDMFITPFIKVAEELHHLLIKPLEGELSRFKVLGIIPNGKLHLLPFQALGEKNPEGEFRFLLEDKSLFQLNSQSILKFAQKRARDIGGKGKLIAFGNPDNSLKYAEEEIELIKKIFSKSTAYVREDASEDKVKTELTGFDILHLATHGKMKGDIKKSYILLAQSSDGKEDGKLFLREIWGLPLRGFQLVTLSACETAKGREASGDIMVSLETAFLRAGTPTILASLWEVDDQATGILMKAFYHNLKKQGKAEALRGAQAALLKDPRYVYPYYWAPFILVGDWR